MHTRVQLCCCQPPTIHSILFLDLEGSVVDQWIDINSTVRDLDISAASGIYMMEIETAEGQEQVRIVVTEQ